MFHAKETAQENPRAYLLSGTGEGLDQGIYLEQWATVRTCSSSGHAKRSGPSSLGPCLKALIQGSTAIHVCFGEIGSGGRAERGLFSRTEGGQSNKQAVVIIPSEHGMQQ